MRVLGILLIMLLLSIPGPQELKAEVSDCLEIQCDLKEELGEAEDENIQEELEVEAEEEIKEAEEEIIGFKVDGLELSNGIIGEEVLRLKKFLKYRGYMDIAEGYVFDMKTRDAVMTYQRDNGLKVDGYVGKNTYEKINNDIWSNNINIPEVEIAFTTEVLSGNWIVLNKDSNTLYYLNGDKILERYSVGTGKLPQYTPEGKFTIVTKFKNPRWGGAGRYKPIAGGAPNNPLGKRWMGLSIRGGGVYGIHGNSDRRSIGRYVSLGCIRMFNEDVEKLYEIVDIDTSVWIGDESRLREYGVIFNYSLDIDEK